MRRLLTILGVCLLLLVLFPAQKALAVDIPYKFFDEFTATPPQFDRVIARKNIALHYYGGRLILSSTPDGTGPVTIKERLFLSSSFPNEFSWTDFSCGSEKVVPPIDLTDKFFVFSSHQPHNIAVSFRSQCSTNTPTSFGPIYLVNLDAQPAKPFLALPWKYQRSHPNFQSAALSINSFFDHEYPLLSTEIAEIGLAIDTVVSYESLSRSFDLDYSRHDGYDWGTAAGVEDKTPVFAPSDGYATYRSPNDPEHPCGACGHQILFDHGNWYQTRYYHLSSEGLVVSEPNKKVFAWEGTQLGLTGWSGNVRPKSEAGAHIHFMVVYDKNYDGNFDDNIPDGLVDPFGWQSSEPDPWENYQFFYKGLERQGMKSHYLWKTGLDNKNLIVSETGGTREVRSGSYIVSIPNIIHPGEVQLDLTPIPVGKIIERNKPLSHGLTLLAFTTFGNPISSFLNPVILTSDFAQIDLSNIDTSTISFYSSQDGVNWVKENTNVDLFGKKATTSVSHLTDFVLMGEMLDPDPPMTEVLINGSPAGTKSIFEPEISLSLSATDNDVGSGIDYTIYDTGSGSAEYSEPFLYTEEGDYSIGYYSVDIVGNVEEAKLFEFKIQIAPPELGIMFDPEIRDTIFVPRFATESAVLTETVGENNSHIVKLSMPSGRDLELRVSYREKSKRDTVNVELLQYDDQEPVAFSRNRYYVRFIEDEKTGGFKKLVQVFEDEGEEKIRLDYNSDKNITKIIYSTGEEKVTEERAGMLILQVYTEKGTLNYSY